ncbi:hypothetical protein OIU78_009759 [Salix suchowensis]|nr:hypothetical protein OIU78_009759 [Salix suchowensis]
MLYNTTAVAGGQGCHGQEAISDLNSCKRLIRPDVCHSETKFAMVVSSQPPY